MLKTAETKIAPEQVWRAWNAAHSLDTHLGQVKTQGKFRYQIVNVKRGESFSILWKTWLVKLTFTYRVQRLFSGSQISYGVDMKGPCAWFVKWMIGKKLQRDLETVLRSMVDQLERN